MKRLKLILTLMFIATAPALVQAQEVDVKSIVFEHLGDSYEWHICTIKDKHISLPLPVILRGSDGVWRSFSSANLRDRAVYKGFTIALEGKHKGKIVETDGKRPQLDISLTKNALAIIVICCVLLLVILPLAQWYRRGRMDAPSGFRGCVDMVVEYINDEVIEPCVGKGYRTYSPYLLTMFFFILISNLLGLIPFFPVGANITGNIAVTATLAVITMLVINFSGTKSYWKDIFWPDVPLWLKVPAPIMPAIELLSIFTKPFALMIRLFANIFAGHAVILGLVCVIFVTVQMGNAVNSSMTVVAVLFGVFMLLLELVVAFIQAYVFTLLSGVFIGMARIKQEKQ